VDFLFQPPPIPILSQTVKSFVDTPFQKYQLSLKRQLVGRSMQLDSVLSTLEHCAKTIQQDLLHLRTNADDKTRFVLSIYLLLLPAILSFHSALIERLSETYQPTANNLSHRIASVIDETSTDVLCNAGQFVLYPFFVTFFSDFFDSLEGQTSGLVFLSRVTDNLASSSLFIENIECNQRSAEGWSSNCVTSNSSDFFNRI